MIVSFLFTTRVISSLFNFFLLPFTFYLGIAAVAELADAWDLKSQVSQEACGFDSRPRHESKVEGRTWE